MAAMTGENAAHDDTLYPSGQMFEHDCATRRGAILALGEKCPHCGHIAGEYMPTMTLVTCKEIVVQLNWQEVE